MQPAGPANYSTVVRAPSSPPYFFLCFFISLFFFFSCFTSICYFLPLFSSFIYTAFGRSSELTYSLALSFSLQPTSYAQPPARAAHSLHALPFNSAQKTSLILFGGTIVFDTTQYAVTAYSLSRSLALSLSLGYTFNASLATFNYNDVWQFDISSGLWSWIGGRNTRKLTHAHTRTKARTRALAHAHLPASCSLPRLVGMCDFALSNPAKSNERSQPRILLCESGVRVGWLPRRKMGGGLLVRFNGFTLASGSLLSLSLSLLSVSPLV